MITDNTAQWKLRRISNVINNFEGYWQAQEAVEVGTLRFPRGQNNTGYIMECVEAGTTGTTQPEIIPDENEIANYGDLGVVGRMRMIFNMAEKDVDEVLAMGVAYSRLTYPELWDWAKKRSGLVITESEWMAKYKETGGKFVPYYSSGDGNNTFRTPLLGAYMKGAENAGEIGEYKEAGLPNITGDITTVLKRYNNGLNISEAEYCNGAFTTNKKYTESGTNFGMSPGTDPYGARLYLDASRSNSIYGNSDTVTPETMTGIWVIKAVGIVVDSGNTDIGKMLIAVEQVQSALTTTDNKITGISDYIIESYRNGTEWYEVYKSGKVRQGGQVTSATSGIGTVSLLKAFANTNYTVTFQMGVTGYYGNHDASVSYFSAWSLTTTSFATDMGKVNGLTAKRWIAEGQGA